MGSERMPEHLAQSLVEYVENGRMLCGFLQALVSNDLMRAFANADKQNADIMVDYVRYVYNKMPNGCHGSPEIYFAWLEIGGLNGQAKRDEISPL